MRPGEVIGGRFHLKRLAGSGGMGEIFQAWDQASERLVAVKVLAEHVVLEKPRFYREAGVLSGLRHPAIVRYIEHGETPHGEPYLVMEWLEGQDLSRRLASGRLSVSETVQLGACVARALAEAHARGVVHRDLKPSNIFLPEGGPAQAKVLDFGVAHLAGATSLTGTGAVLGTPGYMAPEQARGAPDVDARADVFALGCVLHECLTGAPAFRGSNVMAVLAKILFDDAPPVRSLRPEVPDDLDALIGQMLAKAPEQRPEDCAAVAALLSAIDPASAAGGAAGRPPRRALTEAERRLISVVLMGTPRGQPGAGSTLLDPGRDEGQEQLHQAARTHGGRLERMADGTTVVTITGTGFATDLAARAARCALALQAITQGRSIALSMGRAELSGRLPIGDAIDRAVRLLDARPRSDAAPIAVDEVIAGLLDPSFEVRAGEAGIELRGDRALPEGARTLLGKPTSCVGRDREIAALESLWAECIEERVSHAVVVTAPAGIGKSRLAHELISAVRKREPGTSIWIGRVDSLRAGSAFALLGQVVRGASDILDGEPLEVKRQKLRARVARHVPAELAARVAEFLGELSGVPFPNAESASLRAAREDAQLMGDQMRFAWLEFVRAEAARHPLLLVLEDLHWGDLPTVRFIDAALRDLTDLPWLVLALARPEVGKVFPGLWSERSVQEIRLKPLSRRASERLVRHILGEDVSAAIVDRLTSLAEGHAFYLEELIRAVATRAGGALPETVLAMVQSRLADLDDDARLVLRAASVFGEVCWLGGVDHLLGGAIQPAQTRKRLEALADSEILVRRSASRFPGDQELAFRHALLREGAYAMLTEQDQAIGHRLAGEWLERHGEGDPIVLAEHFERGRDLPRAAGYYLRAAEQAHRGGDTDGTIAWARRGIERGGSEEVRLALLSLLSESHNWRVEWDVSARYAREVMSLSKPGSAPWARASSGLLLDAMSRNDLGEITATLEAMRGAVVPPDGAGTFAFAVASAIFTLDTMGLFGLGDAYLHRLHPLLTPFAGREPAVRGWMSMNDSYRQAWTKESPWTGLRACEAVRSSFKEINHLRSAMLAQVFLGMNAWFLGALDRAEAELRSILVPEEMLGLMASQRRFCLAGALADRGALNEAREEASLLVEIGSRRRVAVDEARGRWALGDVLLRLGDLDQAEREVRLALGRLHVLPVEHVAATGTLASILLAQRRASEAVETAAAALARYAEMRSFGFKGAAARLVHAEALHAAGEREQARAAIAAARDHVLANARKIQDPALQRSFLDSVPENARTLTLATQWAALAAG